MEKNGICWIALGCLCLGVGVWNAAGVVSIRSGTVANGQQSWVEVLIDGPAFLGFDCRGNVDVQLNGTGCHASAGFNLTNGVLYAGGDADLGNSGTWTFNDTSMAIWSWNLKSPHYAVRWTHFGTDFTWLDKVVITSDTITPYMITPPSNQALSLQNDDKGEATFSVAAGGGEPL